MENKKYYIDNTGTYISNIYPKVLDFTKSDSLIIEFSLNNPDELIGVTFNENSEDLICEKIGKQIKRCIVPKSHFEGKETGYYFTKSNSQLSDKLTCYEVPPIKVILSN